MSFNTNQRHYDLYSSNKGIQTLSWHLNVLLTLPMVITPFNGFNELPQQSIYLRKDIQGQD